ncbi:hypothetical protein GGR57DRAFT_508863 [Xylariaceae sp. FL1272]|nr:hypothetical protein GGR57DRAFT_508863 [Xylariaceae sp. FL1272]
MSSSSRRGIPLLFNHICEQSSGCSINPGCSASRRSSNRTTTDSKWQMLTLLGLVGSCHGGNCQDGTFTFSEATNEGETSHAGEQLPRFWQAMIHDLAKRDFRAKHPESGSVEIQVLSAKVTWTRDPDFVRRRGSHSDEATIEHLAMGAKYEVIRYVTVDYCTRPAGTESASRHRSKSSKVSDKDSKASKGKGAKGSEQCPYSKKWDLGARRPS